MIVCVVVAIMHDSSSDTDLLENTDIAHLMESVDATLISDAMFNKSKPY